MFKGFAEGDLFSVSKDEPELFPLHSVLKGSKHMLKGSISQDLMSDRPLVN